MFNIIRQILFSFQHLNLVLAPYLISIVSLVILFGAKINALPANVENMVSSE